MRLFRDCLDTLDSGYALPTLIYAAQSARPPRNFGKGDVRGVLAPEAAHDAKDGGSLLPTLALGIPASAGTAVLLGVLAIHGIRPGQELMTEGLPLLFALVWALM